MTDVVSIQFRGHGKTYFFDPNGLTPEENQAVIVETAKGLEYGICTRGVHSVSDESVVQPLRPVVRLATVEDEAVFAENKEKEKRAFDVCMERIAAHGLDMKLVDVEYGFEGNKILFFFTSDGRVDFRALVKDLAAVFRTRIELRQIGVRDGAKMLGGLGICGRPFCCTTFLEDFQPVSIKMAKAQSLSLNPAKISGTCGRLMCCLKYEQEAYEYLIRTSPKEGSVVETPSGKGVITDLNLLRRTARVRLDNPAETTLQTFPLSRLGYTLNGVYVAPEPEPQPEPEPVKTEMPRPVFTTIEEEPHKNGGERPQRNHSNSGEQKKPAGEHRRPGGKKPQHEGKKPVGEHRKSVHEAPKAAERKRPAEEHAKPAGDAPKPNSRRRRRRGGGSSASGDKAE